MRTKPPVLRWSSGGASTAPVSPQNEFLRSHIRKGWRPSPLGSRSDVRTALAATLGLRLFCSAIAAAAYAAHPWFLAGQSLPGTDLVQPWLHWDTGLYLDIARTGYSYYASTAFMPLYPLLIRLVGMGLGGQYLLAGLLISTISTFGALLCLYRLVERFSSSPETARWAIVIAVLLPVSFFLMAAYTEALFLWLTFAALLAFLQGQWGRMALLAALATLTRQQGLLLAFVTVPLFLGMLKAQWRAGWNRADWRLLAKTHWKPLLATLAGPLTYLAWLLVITVAWHAALPWQTLESSKGWSLHFAWPWEGLLADLAATARGVIPVPLGISVRLDAAAALLVGSTLVFARRRFPLGIVVFLVANWCLALMKVQSDGLTVGTARYLLPLLPLALLPAELLARNARLLRPVWMMLGVLFLFTLTWSFISGGWIN